MNDTLNDLYKKIKHGDNDHQKWLYDKLHEFGNQLDKNLRPIKKGDTVRLPDGVISIVKKKEANDITAKDYPGVYQISDCERIDEKDTPALVTRVEVIDENGRSYVNGDRKNRIELSYQDNGRTLKIFIDKWK